MCVCIYMYIFSKTSLTDHLHTWPTPYIDYFIQVPNDHPYNTIVMVFKLPKLTTSLIGPW